MMPEGVIYGGVMTRTDGINITVEVGVDLEADIYSRDVAGEEWYLNLTDDDIRKLRRLLDEAQAAIAKRKVHRNRMGWSPSDFAHDEDQL